MHSSLDNPSTDDRPIDQIASVLLLVVHVIVSGGIAFFVYFDHLSVAHCGGPVRCDYALAYWTLISVWVAALVVLACVLWSVWYLDARELHRFWAPLVGTLVMLIVLAVALHLNGVAFGLT